eukprot:CAMPEP_0118716132 /NCGR_PEP_ID=MMETSP0800-20121206/27315_1 /TAXON_ID=210618 ORGANISM="Striatella unipunctata, Strain CCMP2910" /NCGR_SAMPLE_ID=MMETSP0800 /ASSEMBLY_ACC=CAM_ASM_000638 /LENGTH=697 /DNA_ID=CAMNT_0006622487 /DNA_START=667 /DNA_END=2760 /DNA_ORIENTATION=-
MFIHRTYSEDHFLRFDALAMGVDTLFDITAKIFYMTVILELHKKVFDAEGRSQRMLLELRRLVSVLWESSSDAIIISVRHKDGKISSMLSPSFLPLVQENLPRNISMSSTRTTAALMLETNAAPSASAEDNINSIESAYYVDSSVIPYDGNIEGAILMNLGRYHDLAVEGSAIIRVAWDAHSSKGEEANDSSSSNNDNSNNKSSTLLMHQFQKESGDSSCACEMKISPHGNDALVVVVRDVTERVKRYDAERRAHLETLARQRDAQAINRFTRHEVKNGLLASMELCDNLKATMGGVITSVVKRIQRGDFDFQDQTTMLKDLSEEVRSAMSSNMTMSIEELDSTLSQVLGTVMAEAMARDVIHQVYVPKLESLDVKEFLTKLTKKEETRRYPFHVKNTEMPTYLMMDCQLLRYIHRNAVSNACKYGKIGGQVVTTIDYDVETRIFAMKVINEAGEGHDDILSLGDRANEMVFAEGSRLKVHQDADDKLISSGDGAWIMSKCAQTLGGTCSIGFDPSGTTFLFQCCADPAPAKAIPAGDASQFQLPPGTWGIGIDDSKIQRRLMERILLQLNVDQSKMLLLGQEPNEVYLLSEKIKPILEQDPTSRILILMDENLDYSGADAKQIFLSGSKVMEEVLNDLSPEDESRLLALIRSANDSANDVEKYSKRAHGFFPKGPAQREKVQETIMPLWTARFSEN